MLYLSLVNVVAKQVMKVWKTDVPALTEFHFLPDLRDHIMHLLKLLEFSKAPSEIAPDTNDNLVEGKPLFLSIVAIPAYFSIIFSLAKIS